MAKKGTACNAQDTTIPQEAGSSSPVDFGPTVVINPACPPAEANWGQFYVTLLEMDALRRERERWAAQQNGPTAAIDLAPLHTNFQAMQKREAAIVAAQVSGVMAGADPAIYTRMLREVAVMRQAAQDALTAAEKINTPIASRPTLKSVPRPTREEAAERLADAGKLWKTNIESEHLDVMEKRQILGTIIECIVPIGEPPDFGLEITLRRKIPVSPR